MDQMAEAMKKIGLKASETAVQKQDPEAARRLRKEAEDSVYNLLHWVMAGSGRMPEHHRAKLRELTSQLVDEAMDRARGVIR